MSYIPMTEVGEHLNNTVVPLDNDDDHPLAPGVIAAVTIGSMYMFFFILMMIVCLGELYQYTHGKKRKPAISSNSSRSSYSTNQSRRRRNHSNTETSASHSDPRSSASLSHSDETSTNPRQFRMTRTNIVIVEHEEEGQKEQCTAVNEGAGSELDPLEITDFASNCSNRVSDIEVSTIPLLSRHSTEIQLKDDEILSDSAESSDFHKLEASV